MKRTIFNPYKVQFKTYFLIVGIAIVVLVLSLVIPTCDSAFWKMFFDVMKNLSYGCIASTVVALLIDYANVKTANKKANDTYDSIYIDLKVQIAWFVGTWAQMCAVSFKEKDYFTEKYSWTKWYEITKSNYDISTPERQKQLLIYFHDSLLDSGKYVSKSIDKITSQSYTLTINDAMNTKLKSIISDFKFEFDALCTDLSSDKYEEYFWKHMDAINKDLINYIAARSDISFYNTIEFQPYKFIDVAKYEFAKED